MSPLIWEAKTESRKAEEKIFSEPLAGISMVFLKKYAICNMQ
jgi:hypothetical protein